MIKDLEFRIDVETLDRDPLASTLNLNEIGRVKIVTTQPLCYDFYSRNRGTGSFIIIDEQTHLTAAAGMICQPHKEMPVPESADDYMI
jgi:bifunctional enzyme CysN/CysC